MCILLAILVGVHLRESSEQKATMSRGSQPSSRPCQCLSPAAHQPCELRKCEPIEAMLHTSIRGALLFFRCHLDIESVCSSHYCYKKMDEWPVNVSSCQLTSPPWDATPCTPSWQKPGSQHVPAHSNCIGTCDSSLHCAAMFLPEAGRPAGR